MGSGLGGDSGVEWSAITANLYQHVLPSMDERTANAVADLILGGNWTRSPRLSAAAKSPATDDGGLVRHRDTGLVGCTAQPGGGEVPESRPAPGGRWSLGRAIGQGWVLFLAGFVALAGGVSLLVNPDADLQLVRWLVGLFLAGWGVPRLVHAVRARGGDRTWLVLSGLAVLVAGIVVLAWPAITLAVLLDILVVAGLSLAAVDLVGAMVNRRRDPGWWLSLLRGLGTLLLVAVLLVWPDETLNVVRVLAAVLLILWGAATMGEAYGSPIRDDPYRRQLDQEVRRLI